MELQLLARYPFLPAAREFARSTGYTAGDLLTDSVFDRARRRALERVRGCLFPDGIQEVAFASSGEEEIELLSYPLARMILAHFGDDYLSSRYAVAESKLANGRLSEEDQPETVQEIAVQLGVPLQPAFEGDSFASIHFVPYLRLAPTRDAAWKLVNQRVKAGLVSLPRDKVIRLVEEGIRARLNQELESLEKPGREVSNAFGHELNAIQMLIAAYRAKFEDDVKGPVVPELFPPCIKAIWAGIQAHQNIPHMGRFAIVTFLHKLGMDSEAILKFFAAVPDFDASKSRYQIEHITGKIGGSTEYTPPTCSTMQTYAVCPLEQRDYLCLNVIRHPLSYYRRRVRDQAQRAPTVAPKPTGEQTT